MPPTRHERHTASAKVMFQYGNKKVLMRWPQSYKDAIVNARSELKLGDEELEMFIDMAEVKADRASGEMKLSPTSWDLLSECNNTPLIMLKRAELACVAPPYYMDSVCTLFQAGSVEEQPPPIAARPRFPSHVALASIPPKVSVGPSARLHSNECTKEVWSVD
ncbi:hypothetical protein BKA62DRAFT_716296 [Auriculariales sp. MPI-PUGE-AT-0066]|nr:hypothetical protein BKA62DRAFT_716296 [Auriculariales sp. MPI-PUGE-AT-0066]